jgi:signal transduction histidine kinase
VAIAKGDRVFMRRLEDRSLRFLLYLEWSLLGIAALSEVVVQLPAWMTRSPGMNVLYLVLFGVMGLYLPRTAVTKVLYMALQVSLLLLAVLVGRVFLSFTLGIILVIRSCLMFEASSRFLITGMTFVFFLFLQAQRFESQTERIPVRRIIIGRISPSPLPGQLPPGQFPPRHFSPGQFPPGQFPRRLPHHWPDQVPQDLPAQPLAIMDHRAFLMLSLVVLFGLVLLFLQLLIDKILAEQRSREALATANQQLRDYALKIEEVATLQERNRLAREIHDSLGHSLTALNLHLKAAIGLWQTDMPEAQSLVTEAQDLSQQALREVRQSVSTMRSNPLGERSLAAAIGQLAEDLERTTGIVPQLLLAGLTEAERAISQTNQVALYRLVQESFTNICRHAEASQVGVAIERISPATVAASEAASATHRSVASFIPSSSIPSSSPRPNSGDWLQVRIWDNGKGFSPAQTESGFGLRGMRERVTALQGSFVLNSSPSQGCTLVIEIPCGQP